MAVAYLGLIASVIVVTLQAWGQQRVDAMRSAIVFGLEPVFAALTAWVLIGEQMGAVAMAGAALIVVALIFSQWTPAAHARAEGAAHSRSSQDLNPAALLTPHQKGALRRLFSSPLPPGHPRIQARSAQSSSTSTGPLGATTAAAPSVR
jgi:hypothetical protein